MFYFAPGDPRLTEIRVLTRAPIRRVILVPFPVGVGILKSSSCLTERLILIHTEKARPDRSRPLFQTFRAETKWQLIRKTRLSDFLRFGNLRNFYEKYNSPPMIDQNFTNITSIWKRYFRLEKTFRILDFR